MRAKLKRLTYYLQENQKPLSMVLLPFSLLCFVFLITPHFAFAMWPFDSISDAIGDYFSGAFLGMAEALFRGGIWAVNVSISFTSSFLSDPTKTLASWQKIRGIALGLFGIAILIIAFMNLLRLQIQVWGVNRMIPKLFLAIFAVIFSKFICISIINFGTALANTFTQGIMGFDNMNALVGGSGMNIFQNTANTSFSTIAAIFIFSALAFVVFLLLAIILFFRAVVLALLIVVSPLAFALTLLPWTQKYFQEWWKYFLKWTFFFPVCIIILTIGFSLIPSQPDTLDPFNPQVQAGKVYYCIRDPKQPAGSPENWPSGCTPQYSLSAAEKSNNSAASSFFGMIASLAVGLIAVVLSVFLPLKMLGAFGAVVGDVLSGKKGIPGAPLDMKSMRDWGSARSKKISARKADRASRMMRKPFANNRIGTFITGEDAMDRAAIRDEKANMIKKNLSVEQQKELARNGGNYQSLRGGEFALSKQQEQWYNAFASRGGSHEDIIRNLANEGNLNHKTATDPNVKRFLETEMDANEAYKKSNLHHLRTEVDEKTGKRVALPFQNMALGDHAKMIPPNTAQWSAESLATTEVGYINNLLEQREFNSNNAIALKKACENAGRADLAAAIERHPKGKGAAPTNQGGDGI